VLDGINYYPKKKKPKKGKLLWFFLFLLIFGSMWYYFQLKDANESKSNSIIISQPSLDDVSENRVVENSDNLSSPKEIKEVTENLDEVISTYEANTQN
jgi:ATP-dependent Zn protease